jgi:outer membrane protein
MNRRVMLAVLLCLSCGMPCTAQKGQRLTLPEAEKIAIQNHPQLQAATFEALAAKEVTTEVRSAYLPFAYGSLTAADAQGQSRIAAGGLNNPIIYERYANGVTVNQLVTDFGRTHNLVGAARLHADAQQETAQATRADVLLGVDRAYYELLRAQAVLRVAQATVKERQLVADQVHALAKNQMKSSLDVSFADVNLAQVKLLVVQAQNQLDAASADLSQAMGNHTQQTYELDEEPLPPAPPGDIEELLTEAFQKRPELSALRYDSEAAHKFATAERDLWLPTISAIGTAGLVPYRTEALASRYAAAGVNVNIPLFDGRLFSARHAEAELKAKAEDQRFRDLEDSVARDVRVAWLNANSSYQRLDLTDQLLAQAKQALDLAQARYKLGLSSIVELSQAQLSETEAEIEQAGAKYDYQIQRSLLNYQTGMLR